jgi:hypothetical protein
MPVRSNPPQPVNFTPDKVTRVNIQVPCTINGTDITTTLQNIQTAIEDLTRRIVVLERKTASLP